MPKVGRRHFAYTSKGRKDAEEYAKKTGKKVTNRKPKRKKKMVA
tara:strand:+ start:2747 stop:2878 length:132 start_codon:yes stop_codon:yes gene_type:complete